MKKEKITTEYAQSYTGLGGCEEMWKESTISITMTKNIETKPVLEKNKETIFRNIIDEVSQWDELWKYYNTNPDIVEKPLNADEFSKILADKYDIEEL